MKRPPVLTEDGALLLKRGEELSVDESLGVPRLEAIMRLEETSDTLRGILRDLIAEKALRQRCHLIGRSGHSQIGLDVDFAGEDPEIDTNRRRVDVPVVLTSLNGNVHDTLLAELMNMVGSGGKRLTVGRLFIPMSAPLSKEEIASAVHNHHLLLPPKAEVSDDGAIHIPLDNVRYLLSTTLFTTGQNADIVLTHGKEGLSLIQHPSSRGLPQLLHPGDFFVGAIRISLGPYLALFDRYLNEPAVFHLAARLLDAVRTTGIRVPRQVEVFNADNTPVDPRYLKVRMHLYPADPATARVAARVFGSGRAEKIIRDGVDFADATDIFNLGVCEALFDNLSASPCERGNYGRVLSRSKVIDIQRDMEEGEWHEGIQNRIIYEVVRGRITSGVHRGDQITPDLRGFVDRLETVGGAQDLRNVYVSHEFPATDTLRVLKRNNVGVFVGRSIRSSEIINHHPLLPKKQAANIYFSQTTYETFCDLSEHDGVRFYMIFDEEGQSHHVREFHRGFWTTREGKEKLGDVHTIIAMFGSHVEGAEEILTEQIHQFLRKMNEMPEIMGRFAICHGSGPGVMRIADEAAKVQGVLRIGVGIDSEKIGQKPNLDPPVMVNFMNSARHMRQNILDRTSLFKIYNIGGIGTFEEILIAITNLKLYESLPAPHIFVDPFGLGEKNGHLWELTMRQLHTAASMKTIGKHAVHLAPAWVPNFCHIVKDYSDALTIIERFVHDPIAYWTKAGIQDHDLVRACENAQRAHITIPPYIEKAVQAIQSGSEMAG